MVRVDTDAEMETFLSGNLHKVPGERSGRQLYASVETEV